MKSIAITLGLMATALATMCAQAVTPMASAGDPRIRFIDFKNDEVVTIAVARGVVTRAMLGSDEAIVDAGVGFPSKCEDSEAEWCIRAEKGSNQIWIKPKDNATTNNIEIATTKRDYSLHLIVVPGAEKAAGVYHRVIFRHALPPTPLAVRIGNATPTPPQEKPAATAHAADISTPVVRNASYSRQVSPKSDDIVPSVVFDDGRFTFFQFAKNTEPPALFALTAAGEEVRMNYHAERLSVDPSNPSASVEMDYLVVHKVAKEFILRLGSSVVKIINNDYDAKGIETYNGTTRPSLVRQDK